MTNMEQPPGTQVIKRDSLQVRHLRIEVKRGPDRGKTFDIDVEPVRIGTADGCDVRLTDTTVSGLHVELQRSKHGILVKDLGSTNGTFVDERRILSVFADQVTSIRAGSTELLLTPLKEGSPVEVDPDSRFGEMVGASVAMRALFAKLKKVAASNSTVLITGETGTGKELTAAAIRDHSSRANSPFVVVDCGALPANLIESELLGHERGAFTGADKTRQGAFERAHGGTIFLDEIGELPLSLQPALLGILERREARRVGGSKPVSVDVRVIAATNRDLAQEVARGAFRADLYYRLAIVEVRQPPLRERMEDVPALVEHFLNELPGPKAEIPKESIEQLTTYPWPGNIRELRNVIERAALLAEPPNPTMSDDDAPKGENFTSTVDINRPFKELKAELVGTFEEAYVRQLIEATQGNIAAAARKARIDRMYLYKLLDRYQIEVPSRNR